MTEALSLGHQNNVFCTSKLFKQRDIGTKCAQENLLGQRVGMPHRRNKLEIFKKPRPIRFYSRHTGQRS